MDLKVYIELSLLSISQTKELLENLISTSPINYKGIDLHVLVDAKFFYLLSNNLLCSITFLTYSQFFGTFNVN